MAYLKKLFPQVKEFFFDDDTFTANLPRAREIAKKLAPLGLAWSCNSRANLDYDTIKFFKDCGLRLFLVGYESGNEDILTRIKKGVTLDEMRRFTQACHQAGVVIHGTFVLGLPIETPRPSRTPSVCQGTGRLQPPGLPGRPVSRAPSFSRWPARTVGSSKRTRPTSSKTDGFQQSALEYPGLSKEDIFEAVDRFYRAYYFAPGRYCASSKRCSKTKTSSSAAAAKATSSSRACASARKTSPPPGPNLPSAKVLRNRWLSSSASPDAPFFYL